MADNSLNEPVILRAVSLNASSIPGGYTPAYTQYILSQSTDITNVAGKANDAGQGAYDAQARNDEQDVTLADHEQRISAAEETLVNHEQRITSAENDISSLQTDVGAIQADYVSKSETSQQSLSSPLNVTTSYSVGGIKVVGARQTGWTPSTGTALLSAFNADQAYPIGTTYTQAEIQALADGLIEARQRIKALEDMNRTHGLIN